MAQKQKLSVSIVVYKSDIILLKETISTLNAALKNAFDAGILDTDSFRLWIINNDENQDEHDKIESLIIGIIDPLLCDKVRFIFGHGNVGYGLGHNIALINNINDYHLILNPDVILNEDTITNSIDFMSGHQDVGLLAPIVHSDVDQFQYLCKRTPTVFDLLLRGFAPGFVKSIFRKRLDRYEMRDIIGSSVVFDVPIVSGAFMFFRTSVLLQVAGFSKDFFLYFEDFDISLRMREVSRTAYVPSVHIKHMGGNAAKKGSKHIWLFVKSAITFFNKHGWKWY